MCGGIGADARAPATPTSIFFRNLNPPPRLYESRVMQKPPIDLLARFVAGDEQAFAEVVQTFQDMALRYASALLQDGDEARDVVQEAFIDAHQHRADLRDPGAFSAWLRAIVRSRAARLRRLGDGEPLPGEVESPDPGPEARLAAEQERRVLAAAVADLPEPERVVVYLFYLSGSKQEDIASFLDVPLGTVKNRLFRARARLGERLLDELRVTAPPLPAARPSLDFVQRVRFFRALDRRDRATLEWLLEAHPALAHERRRRNDERVAGVRWGMTALHLAARSGNVELCEVLLAQGADIEADNRGPDVPPGGTPLYVAAAYGHCEAVRLLLRRGATPTGLTPAVSPLRAAIVHAHFPDVAQLLVDAGAMPTIFEWVAMDERDRVAALLETEPALVRARTEGTVLADNATAHTPLHVAARKNLAAMVSLLLDRGAERDALDATGRTPVDQALARGQPDAFAALVARGATPHPNLVAQARTVERARRMDDFFSAIDRTGSRGRARPRGGRPHARDGTLAYVLARQSGGRHRAARGGVVLPPPDRRSLAEARSRRHRARRALRWHAPRLGAGKSPGRSGGAHRALQKIVPLTSSPKAPARDTRGCTDHTIAGDVRRPTS